MTAPMKLPKSETLPTLSVFTSATSRSRISGQRFDGAKTREAAEHFWPWYSNEPRRIAVATRVDVGGRVRDDEVLAAGLADDARVVAVLLEVRGDRPPHAVEDRGRAGEVDAGELGARERRVADLRRPSRRRG